MAEDRVPSQTQPRASALSAAGRMIAALALLALVAVASTSQLESGDSSTAAWPTLIVLALAGLAALALAAGGLLFGGYASFIETTRRTKLLVGVIGTLVLTALLVAGGAFLLGTGRRRGSPAPAAAAEEAVALALAESLDDLRRERDVRRAIVACYARMERALASRGAARRPQEAPFEYLQRVLEAIAAPPARTLTELFERAKFSLEPMGAQEKEQAIAALEALQSEVGSLAPGGASA